MTTQQQGKKVGNTLHKHLPTNLRFRFRTLTDINEVLSYLAPWVPETDNFLLGVKEVMVNAVEHGNLGIGYELKTRLLEDGTWLEEIEKRLALPENRNKYAIIEIEFDNDKITFTVKDRGKGFDYEYFINLSRCHEERPGTKEFNGRGLRVIHMMTFDSVDFSDGGSKVRGVKILSAS